MSLFRFLGRLIDRIWPADHGFQWTGQGAIDDAGPGHMPALKPSVATDAWRLYLNQDAFDTEFEAIAAQDDPDYRDAAYIRDLFRDEKKGR